MQYRIAIPSRGRAQRVYTLELADQLEASDTIIFVHDASEQEAYEAANPGRKVVNTEAPVGVQNIRNWMLEYYSEGERVLFLDDDISGVYALNKAGGALVEQTPEQVRGFVRDGWQACETFETKMFGVYPVKNHFFMGHSLAVHQFIPGGFMGIQVSGIRCDEELRLKVDYDLTIKHILAHGRALRFNNICLDVRQRERVGGCDYRTPEAMDEACNRLLHLYPKYVKRHPSRRGEIRLAFRLST